jgi:peroxiredoxin
LAIRGYQTRDAARGPAPAFEGVTIDGEPVALGGSTGHATVVHFWATWCGVCEVMAPNVDGLADGARVVTVASQSGDASQIRAHLHDHELSFPTVSDPEGRLARSYGVHAFPTSFVIGPDGVVRYVEVGYTTELGLRARLWLASW